MLLGELVPLGGGDPIPLLKDKLQVGRRNCCDIVLQFPNVSSRHSELQLIDGFWLITDLSSRNGTKINGVRVRRKWAIPGDQIGFARHKFEIVYAADGDAPIDMPGIDGVNDFSQSLMEKAGLVRRNPKQPPQPPSSRAEEQEIAFAAQSDSSDEITQWLSEGDED